MAIYTGSRPKVMRGFGVKLPGSSRTLAPHPSHLPGRHRHSGRLSACGTRLKEKQKLGYAYGIGELQLRRLITEAERGRTPTNPKTIELVERLPDNVSFRAGPAPIIPAVRPLVVNSYLLDGRRVDVRWYRMEVNERVAPTPKAATFIAVKEGGVAAQVLGTRPRWLGSETEKAGASVLVPPTAKLAPFQVNPYLVIKFDCHAL